MQYLLGILGIVFGDGFVKKYIEENKTYGEEEKKFGNKIIVTKYHNKGAMLNFMQEKPEWVLRFSFAGLGAAFLYLFQLITTGGNVLLKTGTALLLGGGLSNLYDRIKKGYVVDYFIINYGRLKKVIFNLSDMLIFLGGLLLLIGSLFEDKNK
ncbi:MAG: signal peptidase [Clostridiales bacterium]|nr:signal peptidase [Clostridiales bacterium]